MTDFFERLPLQDMLPLMTPYLTGKECVCLRHTSKALYNAFEDGVLEKTITSISVAEKLENILRHSLLVLPLNLNRSADSSNTSRWQNPKVILFFYDKDGDLALNVVRTSLNAFYRKTDLFLAECHALDTPSDFDGLTAYIKEYSKNKAELAQYYMITWNLEDVNHAYLMSQLSSVLVNARSYV